jgi:predicted nuclease of restriction endonuclease-like RecB superfamily
MTEEEMDEATKGLLTKSSKIRQLAELGATRSEIARYLQIRYQHVRNVLVGPSPAPAKPVVRETVMPQLGDVMPMSIAQAKRALAAHFGISPDAIEITIRG